MYVHHKREFWSFLIVTSFARKQSGIS